tara:strand:+ start:399 stop:857 length:459 start_codon:yes stop_codon:yes gene_type:complete
MKVILLENLKRIGSIGEVIDVKRGFARNFLIANKKALYASRENIQQVERIKSDLSKKDNEKKQEAKKISEKINKKEFSVKKLSTENNELYGSVKPTEISKLILEESKIDIKPSMIQPIKEIKSLGKFKVRITLHSEVDAEIMINVNSAEIIQ